MYNYKCVVENIEELRLPGVYRVHSKCGEYTIVIEMHEDVMKIVNGEEMKVVLTNDKSECMENEFCGKGHVVSITKFDKKYRVIISIGGFLFVLKGLEKPIKFNVMDELYIGISRTS
ncbi:MAG: hypothetical protein B6U89_01345 [Desulfurococcales archaeon ex4484_58]|nr:MAG: hypothetical protein B6U89_01345 [Desulfurococcales archaeon ex4484_58]